MSATRFPRIALATAALAATVALPLRADTLVVDAVAEDGASAGERPARGMTMGTVARRWGAPESRSAAVGQPPITRWEYPGFTVFFEYQHVVHAVRRRAD